MSDAPDRLLNMFRETFRSEVHLDQPDLSMRQLAILLVVYQTNELQTVRGLAKHLSIKKTSVMGVLDRLREFDLARRKVDPQNRRSVNVVRTETGAAMMRRLADTAETVARQPSE